MVLFRKINGRTVPIDGKIDMVLKDAEGNKQAEVEMKVSGNKEFLEACQNLKQEKMKKFQDKQ